MSTSRLLAAALAALLAGCAGLRPAAPPSGPALPAESYTLAGPSITIENPAGAVRVQPGTGPDVQVSVTRAGADAERLRIEPQHANGGDILHVRIEGPARLLYPGMPGRSDSLQLRATRSGYATGRGGFLGLFAGRSLKVVRRPGRARASEAHADMVVSVPAGRRVDLHVGAGAVQVRGQVGELRVASAAGDVELDSAGGRITVIANAGGVFGRAGTGELTVSARAGSVNLPGFSGSRLEASTGAGTIRGQSLSAAILRLHTGAGAVEVAGARATTAELRSGSGRVVAGDVVADSLRATSGLGDLTLTALRVRAAAARTARGDVSADLAVVPAWLRVDADGDALLALPGGAGADLALRSEHGRVSVPGQAAGRSLTARLGSGGGRIEVRAEHDVTVRNGPIEAAPEAAR